MPTETIDIELLRIKIQDTLIHNGLPPSLTDSILNAIAASVLPLPYKLWEPELLKQEAAKDFIQWLIDNGYVAIHSKIDIEQLYLKYLNDKKC